MAESEKKPLTLSNPKVLCGLSVVLALTGAVVIDPVAGFICFLLAGILALLAAIYATGRVRYIAALLLLPIIIVLAVSIFPSASNHLKAYTSTAVTEGMK